MRKHIEFSLDAGDVARIQSKIDAGFCELTGVEFNTRDRRKFNSPSIDRIDSSRGYTPDNIRIVCFAINAAMCDWGADVIWSVFESWRLRKLAETVASDSAGLATQ